MGSIVTTKINFIEQLSITIKFKSGLDISIEKYQELVSNEHEYLSYFQEPFDTDIQIDSVEFEELVAFLLEKIGVSGSSDKFLLVTPYSIPYVRTAFSDKANKIGEMFIKSMEEETHKIIEGETSKTISLKDFSNKAFRRFGILGRVIAQDMASRYYMSSLRSPYSVDREIEWSDIRELDELFESENLKSQHGDYFDQRFINYLNENYDEIGKINWRQFEGLAGEYLTRAGFYIEMGPGRGDGGVDIRAWTNKAVTGLPPAILVQVKRYSSDVDQTVVKALWADMSHEKADSGLIVTTSKLAPSAKTVSSARSYKINEANRETVEQWIKQMRMPQSRINFLIDN